MGKLSAFIGLAAVAGIGFYVGKKVYEKKKNEETAHVYDTDSEVFVEEKHSTPKEKLQRASLFAVGALKTGTEKFKEGIDEIINQDMVAKGEDTVAKTKEFAKDTKEKTVNLAKDAKAKTVQFTKEVKEKTVNLAKDAKAKTVELAGEAGETIKTEIDHLKSMVSSINTTPAEETEEADAVEESIDITEAPEEAEEEVTEVTASTDVAEIGSSEETEIPEVTVEPEEKQEEVSETEEAADDIDSISLDTMDTVSIDTFDFGASEQL